MIAQDMFETVGGESEAAFHIAGIALDHWDKYSEVIGDVLKAELKQEVKINNWSGVLLEDLRTLTRYVLGPKGINADYMRDNLTEFKKRLAREDAMRTMLDQHEAGTLTDEGFIEICASTVSQFSGEQRPVADIFDEIEMQDRVVRRALSIYKRRFHLFFIEPLDKISVGIGLGHIGLIMAPYKRGKSMMMLWIAVMLTLQGYDVAYFTLEDPLADVEDRLDSLLSDMNREEMIDMPDSFKTGWHNFRRNARGRMRVIDMRDIEAKVSDVENEYEKLRRAGFIAQCVLIDYDNLLLPDKRQSNRKEELTALYRELVRWVAKHNVMLWLASQTDANSEEVHQLSGKDLADDKGKLRHVTMAIGLGAPSEEWPESAIYLYVPAHRNAASGVGCHVIPNRDASRIYDSAATSAEAAKISEMPRPDTEENPKGSDFKPKGQKKGGWRSNG